MFSLNSVLPGGKTSNYIEITYLCNLPNTCSVVTECCVNGGYKCVLGIKVFGFGLADQLSQPSSNLLEMIENRGKRLLFAGRFGAEVGEKDCTL